jgi:hypothetical protein
MQRTKGPKCACGCGLLVRKHVWRKGVWNKYILGHGRKGAVFTDEHRKHLSDNKKKYYNTQIPIPKYCACGCGQITNLHRNKYRNFVLGHNRKDVIPSKECKEKLSIQKRGDLNPSKRKEVRERISNTLRILYSDMTKHPAWKGGLSFEPYGREFNNKLKQTVRNICNNTCQLCGISQIENKKLLDVHHIDYNKKNNTLPNLIALCHTCHMKTNKNRKYWTKLFTIHYGENKVG